MNTDFGAEICCSGLLAENFRPRAAFILCVTGLVLVVMPVTLAGVAAIVMSVPSPSVVIAAF